MMIECDLEDDGSLDELEVQRYSDEECEHEFGDEIEIKPYKCVMDPWEPGRYLKLTFEEPPMSPILALIVFGLFCLCCVCLCCCAVMTGAKTKVDVSYSSFSDDHDD